MEPGRLDLRLGSSLTYGSSEHLAECPDLGPECDGPVAPTPYYHHVDLVASDVSLDLAYGVAPWFAVEARLSLRIVDTTPTYFEVDGAPKLVPDDIHHHDETLVGPGDPWLVARFGGAWGKLVTAARLGVTVPLGSTQEDPYALGAEGKWHEHTQLGTGTFNPILGLGLSYDAGAVELSMSALGVFGLYANEHGYRPPSRYFVGLRGAAPLLGGTLTPFGTVELAHETDETWGGAVGLEGSTRRTDLLVGAGLSWEFARATPGGPLGAWRLEVSARGRAAKLESGVGYDSPGVVQLALSTSLDKLGR